MNEKYCPSNGSEGMWFIEKYCMNCIHEKFMHTQEDDDLKCEILTNTMVYDWKDPNYPSEWTYDENDKPCCTAFKKWDWGLDDGEGGGLNEPTPPEPYNPNQLCFPFLTDDILRDHKTKQLQTA